MLLAAVLRAGHWLTILTQRVTANLHHNAYPYPYFLSSLLYSLVYTLCLNSFAARTRTHNAVVAAAGGPAGRKAWNRRTRFYRDFEALRERLSLLSQANLRINESLDFDAVLQGALDSARSLTGARYGVMTLLDDQGGVREFLSSGTTEREAEQLWLTPQGLGIFQALTDISEPVRIPDLAAHIRGLGFADFSIPLPVGVFSFLAAPMFHLGNRVGHVFVGYKDGGRGKFTQADEETLVMFAAQAALVIANAGAYREERRARADLETLVNTSPVGVVVFDAKTGGMASVKPGGAAPGGRPAGGGPAGRRTPGTGDLRARRRKGGLPQGLSPGGTAQGRGDGSSRRRSYCGSPTGAA